MYASKLKYTRSQTNSRKASRGASPERLTVAKRPIVPKPNNLHSNKVNNIIVAERQSASNLQSNHSNHVVNHLQQLPMEQPTGISNNSVQDHLISRLSDQVRGLEDKQDIVKKGNSIFCNLSYRL